MKNNLKSNVKSLLKRNKVLYLIYFRVASALIKVIRIFVKTDDRLILFVSFGGRRYADSPKVIYEGMRHDKRFSGYKLVWGFVNPNDFPEIGQKVKIDTIKYIITSLKARCWVTNVSIERGLSYKGNRTFYLYTGHGSPIKKCGSDVKYKNTFKSSGKSSVNACLAQSEFEKEIRSRLLAVSSDEAYLTGTPTNDILANYDEKYRTAIRKELGIEDNKKAILYAPTFREYSHLGSTDMPEVDFFKWHRLLGDDYVILYRAHPESNAKPIRNEDWFVDVTKWEDIEPLMIASDALISDYSGLITDYSIMHKPIFLWTYDYEQYEKTRGLYFDVRQVLPFAEKETTLLSMIKEGYTQEQKDMLINFQRKYATVYGSATRNTIELLFNKIILN